MEGVRPFTVVDLKTGAYPDCEKIALKEQWAKHLIYCDIDSFCIGEDGALFLTDDCGNVAYCPTDRFAIIFEDEETALTADELRKWPMGEPLYVKLLPPCHSERWEIPVKIVQGSERLLCKGDEVYFFSEYGEKWEAYAHKPS